MKSVYTKAIYTPASRGKHQLLSYTQGAGNSTSILFSPS
jgi:hypothetical protein